MINHHFLKSNYINKLTQSGKETFESDVFFNTCFDKNQLKNLVAWFLENYGEKITVDFLETLKQVGFHQATLAGVSLGIDDLKIPSQKSVLLSQALVKIGELTNANKKGDITSVEKSQRLIDTWNQTSETLRQTAVQNFRLTNPVNPVFMMAFSGARGNISQVRQLVAMRGLMADPQGAILEFPIQSNFREGLTITEYLISCYGARKGLVDTALRTATSGYLTRRLVDAVQHVVVVMIDCKTKKGISIKNKDLEHRLIGRVLLEDVHLNYTTSVEKNTVISPSLAKIIASKYKEIYVRSPLTCNTEKSVCQLCYGVNLAQGKLVSLGEAVGVIAAQSIGEPGTQLTMRTFHTGGVGVFSDQVMKSFNAPFEGYVEFLENLPGLFVRTPYGTLVYLVKYSENTQKKPFLRLKSSTHVYEIAQSEVPSGSLLWVKQGEYVQAGQLLLQASQIKASNQKMPESSHPVYAPFSGEIFFQSMTIRLIEKQILAQAKKTKKLEETISPKILTLVQLGTFWIFSSGVEKKQSISKSFFLQGDLISLKTPVLQYDLTIHQKGQLKRVNSVLVLAQNCFEFLVSKIYYSKLFYILLDQNQKNILVSNTNSKNTVFTWYPKIFHFGHLGYCLIFSNTGNTKKVLPGFFWSEHEILKMKNTAFLSKASSFVLIHSDHSFSRKGIFQMSFQQRFKWSKKSFFPVQSVKNSSQIQYKKRGSNQHISLPDFVRSSLKTAHFSIFKGIETGFIQKKQGWFFIPTNQFSLNITSQLTGILLKSGKQIQNICFANTAGSLNLIQAKNLSCIRSKTSKIYTQSFYSLHTILDRHHCFIVVVPVSGKKILKNFSKKFATEFCFYKPSSICFFARKKTNKTEIQNFSFQLKRKRHIETFLFFQKNTQQVLPEIKLFKQKSLFQEKNQPEISTKSPVFTKQRPTLFELKPITKVTVNIITPLLSEWCSIQNLLKIELKPTFQSPRPRKFKSTFQLFSSKFPSVWTSLSLMFYTVLKFQNPDRFSCKTFENDLVLPEYTMTQAFITSGKQGEFSYFQVRENHTCFGVLRNIDIVNFKFPLVNTKLNSFKIGAIVRWGQEVCPEWAVSENGQVIKRETNTVTIRKGIPILASAPGVVHISNKDLVQQNDLLITLKSRRLQTEDIIQGIPKIEQLFEARETLGGEKLSISVHSKLQEFFQDAIRHKPLRAAVNHSIQQIQMFLVENIVDAYSNQGVKIAEKHVEVIVRQMTARVRILASGDSGLFPGEIIQLKWIERVNVRLERLGYRQATYEPIILGITRSVLQSESFLVAASFQEVSKILVKSALTKKTDFLRGLHENIILGQLIPAGTGIIPRKKIDDKNPLLLKNDSSS